MARHEASDARGKAAEAREQPRGVDPDLIQAGVVFETKNYGAHLIVKSGNKVIDFWPGTGLWIDRSTAQLKRGVRRLIDYLKGN